MLYADALSVWVRIYTVTQENEMLTFVPHGMHVCVDKEISAPDVFWSPL